MVNAAVLGYGTVGSGVVEVLRTNRDIIRRNVGDEVRVKYVLDLRDFPGDPVEDVLVHDFDVIINDPEVDIVVETMGGLKPAFEFTKKALKAGKSVCTSNKELVAAHGTELLQTAKANQVSYLFEASCGGGIPIIRPLISSLTADEIDGVSGILNGTTNYILTKMDTDGSEFSDALAEAQKNGFAERNPSADIEGGDACRKIAILSSIAYGRHISWDKIYTEGISGISAADFKYAQEIGAKIRLVATSVKKPEGYYAMVAPGMVNESDPLYGVNGVFNAVKVHGNMLGDAMFYGSGAGKLPTASAVAGDVVDEARHLHETITTYWSDEELPLQPVGNMENRFFVRVQGSASDRAEEIRKIFGNAETISLPSLPGEFAFITDRMKESEFADRSGKLGGMISRIRVLFA
ncbi:MAG: homoserine dehydrogenase [Eubacteriales bacterium]|jgi:homoserine dehydrogenase